jgi:hypothetical protein
MSDLVQTNEIVPEVVDTVVPEVVDTVVPEVVTTVPEVVTTVPEVNDQDVSIDKITQVTSVSNSLVTLLQNNMKVPSYHLTEEQQSWISLLLTNSPQSFSKIDTDVTSIVASGSLGLHSIPQLVQLCADILNQASNQQGISNAVNIYILIKFILDVLLESSLIPLPGVEKSTIQTLIDTSLGLLSTTLVNSPPVVSTKSCCK